mmetsp:Transcript_3286/g.6477  ORF Transcript_3286/g.6477 Transcript_3286/m.6477 type:complete len:123 (-) Transcript_3286:86-454(-)
MAEGGDGDALSPQELSCLQACQNKILTYVGAGGAIAGGVAALGARSLKTGRLTGALLIGSSVLAGGLGGLTASTKPCMEEILQLESKTVLKKQLVGVMCQWNPGLAEMIEQAAVRRKKAKPS